MDGRGLYFIYENLTSCFVRDKLHVLCYNECMSEIDTYLENISGAQREELERIRKVVREAVPDAEETIKLWYANLSIEGNL